MISAVIKLLVALPILLLSSLRPGFAALNSGGNGFNSPDAFPTSALGFQDADEAARQFIQDASLCDLPCWGGMMPGQSKIPALSRELERRGLNLYGPSLGYGEMLHGINLDTLGSSKPWQTTDVFIGTKADTITSLRIFSFGQYATRKSWQKMWSAYSPEKIITKYGKPTSIFLQGFNGTWVHGEPHTEYYLWLYYEKTGFVIRYGGVGKLVSNGIKLQVCPTFDRGNLASQLEIYAREPQSNISFDKLIGERAGLAESILPLEKATGLTIDTFYKRYTSGKRPFCWNVVRSIWP
jgi:hypothetical protein